MHRYRCASHFYKGAVPCDSSQKSIIATKAEVEAWRQVVSFLSDPERVRRTIERQQQNPKANPYETDLKAAEQRAATIEAARARLARMIAQSASDEDAALLQAELGNQTSRAPL